ncbi:hypothetical protein [Sinorhizobium fredii]|uniref:Uncharacterized protein n=1 Tax=Rhizobium fredii TaxID=380 RepID=A0A2A6M383_RHIFR|nr:hypothetical protein [Sinorhizobium fredii]ASY69974.1 hypothetical protein SF83666_c25600 [Sinorhizobium fredii CCBAU 83666]AWI58178.1 hypothetical protein AB395_00002527 [Sinorhizobium fredii CCBAU 45436]AWM26019.1 hypothetical protein AOX55_00002770 [Sinorhizobium fredii CCBAU 25509]KSV91730.1 hypothetical protein N181_09275 [Sinorhizobium fredii USDA 205]MCG5475455.1 hypothetical protein [Sinorhizobium fredii]
MQTLGAVLTALLAADFGAAASRYKRNALLWAIVAVLLGTAYVFALVAIALTLADRYSPVVATVAIAIALLATALVVVAVMAALNARDRRILDERRRRSMLQTNLALAAATSILKKQPLIGVGTAIAVGLLLGLGKGRRRSDRR